MWRGKFVYPPVDRSTNSIRLLQFRVDQPEDDGIYCALQTYDIAVAPEFVALSYTWGQPKPAYKIILNGVKFRVGENLWYALRELQKAAKSKKLGDSKQTIDLTNHFWIDAICINQDDYLERGHQVNMMKDIYSNAQCVVVSLGAGTRYSDLAMKTISGAIVFRESTLADNHLSMLLQYFILPTPQSTLTDHQRSALSEHFGQSHEEVLTDQQLSALAHLFDRPYWRRLWVVQEFLLAKDLWILCGSRGTWWLDFYACVQILKKRPVPTSFALEKMLRHRSKRYANTDNIASTSQPLSTLMRAFHTANCQDPRDRIYGLLGLIEEAPLRALKADYTISTAQLYCRVLCQFRDAYPDTFRSEWIELSESLGIALEVEREDRKLIYNVHQVVYSQGSGARPHRRLSRPPTSVIPILERHFGERIHKDVKYPQGVCDRVIKKLRKSPIWEYKYMYTLLETRLQEELGLQSQRR
ncbi:heterokaryon incompatibility protein-domain-containing protein [Hypoxylon crocopeplum]|nr:heterokaryon incompatibility protein-domain-containing protein [Hypoxylon crocopeplum]